MSSDFTNKNKFFLIGDLMLILNIAPAAAIQAIESGQLKIDIDNYLKWRESPNFIKELKQKVNPLRLRQLETGHALSK